MPRSRGSSEMPQRQSPRGPLALRTSSTSDSAATTDRSPKVSDHRRSPRGGPHSDPPLQSKKLGTRIADLESQLGQAQQELKSLKEQLASAEAAKNEAQKELENKSKKKPMRPNPQPEVVGEEEAAAVQVPAPADNDQEETDVFEVPAVEMKKGVPNPTSPEEEIALKKHEDEMNELRAKLEEREKELLVSDQEKEELRKQLNEVASRIECGKAKEEEMRSRLSRLEAEVEASRGNAAEMECQLEVVKEGKEMLECEMKRMRVQTEQWRKAADAAAAVLAGGNGRFVSDQRCASMEKPFGGGGGGSVFETPAGGRYGGYVGSPGFGDDMDDGYGSGGKQRKGSSGIKMFGDLWKRKSQK